LRDEAARVPVDICGKTQIADHPVGRPAKRRECFLGELHANRDLELVTRLPRPCVNDAAVGLAIRHDHENGHTERQSIHVWSRLQSRGHTPHLALLRC
jgi:hypothetical protein